MDAQRRLYLVENFKGSRANDDLKRDKKEARKNAAREDQLSEWQAAYDSIPAPRKRESVRAKTRKILLDSSIAGGAATDFIDVPTDPTFINIKGKLSKKLLATMQAGIADDPEDLWDTIFATLKTPDNMKYNVVNESGTLTISGSARSTRFSRMSRTDESLSVLGNNEGNERSGPTAAGCSPDLDPQAETNVLDTEPTTGVSNSSPPPHGQRSDGELEDVADAAEAGNKENGGAGEESDGSEEQEGEAIENLSNTEQRTSGEDEEEEDEVEDDQDDGGLNTPVGDLPGHRDRPSSSNVESSSLAARRRGRTTSGPGRASGGVALPPLRSSLKEFALAASQPTKHFRDHTRGRRKDAHLPQLMPPPRPWRPTLRCPLCLCWTDAGHAYDAAKWLRHTMRKPARKAISVYSMFVKD